MEKIICKLEKSYESFTALESTNNIYKYIYGDRIYIYAYIHIYGEKAHVFIHGIYVYVYTHIYDIYVYMEREREREKFCSLMHSLCASKDCAVLSSHFLLKMSRIQLLQLWSLTLSVLVGRKMWFMDITTSYFKSAPTLF